jgi:hypothetical protein
MKNNYRLEIILGKGKVTREICVLIVEAKNKKDIRDALLIKISKL